MMAQDSRQPDGLVHRSLPDRRAVPGAACDDDVFVASRHRRRTAPGLPGYARRAGPPGGRCGTTRGIPAMAGDWPGSCCQFKRGIEQHVRPGCACMGAVRVRVGSPRGGSGGVRVGQQRWPDGDVAATLAPAAPAPWPGLLSLIEGMSRAGKDAPGKKPWRSYFRGGQITSAFAPTTPMWRVLMPKSGFFDCWVSPLAPALTGCSSAYGEGKLPGGELLPLLPEYRGQNISGHCVHTGYMRLTVSAISQQTASCLPRE